MTDLDTLAAGEPPPPYMIFLVVFLFFLTGLLGFLFCHMLKRKGYRCRTGDLDDDEEEAEQKKVAFKDDEEEEEDEDNQDTVEQILKCIIENEANMEAFKEMLGHQNICERHDPRLVRKESVGGIPSHHHTVHSGSDLNSCHLCVQGRSKKNLRRSRVTRPKGKPGEQTVFSVGRFRVIHTDKKSSATNLPTAESGEQLDQSEAGDSEKGYNLRNMFKDVRPPEGTNGVVPAPAKRRKSLTLFSLRRVSDPTGVKPLHPAVVLEEPLQTSSPGTGAGSGVRASTTAPGSISGLAPSSVGLRRKVTTPVAEEEEETCSPNPAIPAATSTPPAARPPSHSLSAFSLSPSQTPRSILSPGLQRTPTLALTPASPKPGLPPHPPSQPSAGSSAQEDVEQSPVVNAQPPTPALSPHLEVSPGIATSVTSLASSRIGSASASPVGERLVNKGGPMDNIFLSPLGKGSTESVGTSPKQNRSLSPLGKGSTESIGTSPKQNRSLSPLGKGSTESVGTSPKQNRSLSPLGKGSTESVDTSPKQSEGLSLVGKGSMDSVGTSPKQNRSLSPFGKGSTENIGTSPKQSEGLSLEGQGSMESVGTSPKQNRSRSPLGKGSMESVGTSPKQSESLSLVDKGLDDTVETSPKENMSLSPFSEGLSDSIGTSPKQNSNPMESAGTKDSLLHVDTGRGYTPGGLSPVSLLSPSSPLGGRVTSVTIVKASPNSPREFSVIRRIETEEEEHPAGKQEEKCLLSVQQEVQPSASGVGLLGPQGAVGFMVSKGQSYLSAVRSSAAEGGPAVVRVGPPPAQRAQTAASPGEGAVQGAQTAASPGEEAVQPAHLAASPGEEAVQPAQSAASPREEAVQPAQSAASPGEEAARGHSPGEIAGQGLQPAASPGEGAVQPAHLAASPGEEAARGHSPGEVAGQGLQPAASPGEEAARGHSPGEVAAQGLQPAASPGEGAVEEQQDEMMQMEDIRDCKVNRREKDTDTQED